MGLRNEIHRKFWLCTYGVQSRGIQYHQTLFEQGMWNIDQRMAPHGHFNQTVNIWNWVFVCQIVMPETQSTGILNGNPPNFRYLFQGFRNLVRVVHVQCDLHPTLRLQTPICQTLHLKARFNGKQPKARRQC